MPAYETATNELRSAVEVMVQHLTGEAGFEGSVHPNLEEYNRVRDMTYFRVAGALVKNGFSPTQSSVGVLSWLQLLQMYECVIQIELSYPISGDGAPNERFMAFMAQRDAMLVDLNVVLQGLGATTSDSTLAAGEPTVTGVSRDRKASLRQDPDIITSRFARGMQGNPQAGANSPYTGTAAPLEADW